MFRFLAYVDPGTGSFAIQAIIGTVMGISYAARHRIRVFIGKFRKQPPQAAQPQAEQPGSADKPEKS
jgi:hypothetical protein